MDSILHFVFALVFTLCPCFAAKVSKACYGSAGRPCTYHNLKCSNEQIAIQDAFYTNSTVCGLHGVLECANTSLKNISVNGTRYHFKDTDSVFANCSSQSTCSLRATRDAVGSHLFSVIIYQCIKGQSSTPQAIVSDQENAGAIAGGVIGVLVVCMTVSAVLVWFKFVRNKKEDQRPERGNTNHAYAASLSSTATEHRGSRKTSNYDYVTIHNGDNPVGRVQNHYVLADRPRTENGTTVFNEDNYNHINHIPPQGASYLGYDTSASAAAEVKKLKNASSNSIEDEDYNHLGDGKPSVVSSDYNTTVSASKAVAQLGEMKDREDDYDHFKRSEDRVIDSPYDTANHHSIVSTDAAPSPYDLAK